MPSQRHQLNKNRVYLIFILLSSMVYLLWGLLTPAYFITGTAIDSIAYRAPGVIIPFIGILLYWLKRDMAPTQLFFELTFFGYLCSYIYILHLNNYHQIYVLGSFIIQAGANSLIDREKSLISYNILNLFLALAIFIHPAPLVNPYFFLTSVITLAFLLSLTTILKIRAQQQNQALAERLNQEENQRIIFGGLAHEVNNPLMILLSIHNRLSKMLDKADTESDLLPLKDQLFDYIKEKINPMGTTIFRISNIISDLHKTAYGNHILQLKDINLRELITTIVEEENLEAWEDRIKIVGITDLHISFDESSLKKILKELILNATDYAKGSVIIKLAADRISITNDGEKISSEVVDKIFEPFFTTKQLGKGKGLGLSVAKGLAAQNSCSLRLGENNNLGVTFELIFAPQI